MVRKVVIDTNWYDFGADMFNTHDLDPVYSMLALTTTMSDDMLKRWLLAYWCYYSAGVASKVAEAGSDKFYDMMWKGSGLDGNDKWPRGMERRYFYGQQAANLLNGLEDYGSPENIVDVMTCHTDFLDISNNVKSFTGFGPWMGWKIADMAERVLCYDVDFSNSEIGIYKDPVQGAAFIAYGDKHYDISLDELHDVCADMERQYSGYMAPPHMDRPINIQEVETVLCKYKAHCYGFYPYGCDSYHMLDALDGWGDLADEIRGNLIHIAPYAANAVNGGQRGTLLHSGG